jgi:hypothetical protein
MIASGASITTRPQGESMSSGKKSPLFRPIDESMLPSVEEAYSRAKPHVRPIFTILTTDCHVEALLFVAVIDAFDRALGGKPGTIMLSAILNERPGKVQTPAMSLVHDVLVELPMAGRNYKRLQAHLASLGYEWCMMHSCGGDCVPIDRVEAWYDAMAAAQQLRTKLDWEGSSNIVQTDTFISHDTSMSWVDLETINRIVSRTKVVLGLGGDITLINAA